MNKKKKGAMSPARKKKIIRYAVIFCILCLVVGLTAVILKYCNETQYRGKYDSDYDYDGVSLVGKWMDDDADESAYDVYEFVDSDTVILTTYSYGIEKQVTEAKYVIEGSNKLKVSYEYKVGGTGEASIQNDYFYFSITNNKELILLVLDDMNNTEEERVMVEYKQKYNLSNDIVGDWVSVADNTEHFIFNSDFTGKITGTQSEYLMKYSLKDGTIYYIIYQMELEIATLTSGYEVGGDTLTLSGKSATDGSTIVIEFERAK